MYIAMTRNCIHRDSKFVSDFYVGIIGIIDGYYEDDRDI